MAFANLSAVAALRQGLGIKYLLKPDNWDVEEASPPPKASKAATPNFRPTQPTPGARRKAPPTRPEPASQPLPPAPTAPAWRPLPRQNWPQDWQNALGRANQGFVAWTYLKLAKDMLPENTDPAKNGRRQLIASIIKSFGSPRGTHAFWPCAMPGQDGSPVINAEVFWSGLKFLNCRALVIMDDEGAKNLLGLASPPRSFLPPRKVHGFFVWAIEDIDSLVARPESFNHSLANLKRAFRNYFPAVFGGLR